MVYFCHTSRELFPGYAVLNILGFLTAEIVSTEYMEYRPRTRRVLTLESSMGSAGAVWPVWRHRLAWINTGKITQFYQKPDEHQLLLPGEKAPVKLQLWIFGVACRLLICQNDGLTNAKLMDGL